MDSEKLTILDECMEYIGVRTREEVHIQGFWHETFHCWLLKEEAGRTYLLFQLRSADKKDFPSLLDVTAAGHLLAGETPVDGLREVEEELGITLSFEHLINVGVIKEEFVGDGLIDREMCHVYLYWCDLELKDFVLQEEEVAGLVQVELEQFERLVLGQCKTVKGYGYVLGTNGEFLPLLQSPLNGLEKGATLDMSQGVIEDVLMLDGSVDALPVVDLQRSHFCPHSEQYYVKVLAAARRLI